MIQLKVFRSFATMHLSNSVNLLVLEKIDDVTCIVPSLAGVNQFYSPPLGGREFIPPWILKMPKIERNARD